MRSETKHVAQCWAMSGLLLVCAASCVARAPAAATPATPAKAPPPPTPAPSAQAEDRKPAPPAELPAPAHFPAEAREMLRARMIRHGESMTYLMAGVIFLAYEDTRSIAFEIAKEPRLGRPAPDEKDTLNALLPVRFFDLQDQLATRARELAMAADARDDARLVAAFGALAQTCVACHAAYLHDEVDDDAALAAER